jgi:hypothetical protein
MTGGDGMAEWWSIEVFSGDKLPASAWRYAYEDELTEAAITNGALYYEWHDTQYGVVFEVLFPSDEQWEAFRALPAVRAALDGVPDPVEGLIIYRGRGGAAGSRKPRKPKPAPSAAALELEEPRTERRIRLVRSRAKAVDELLRQASVEPPGEPAPVGPAEDDPEHGKPARHGAIAPAANARTRAVRASGTIGSCE